MGQSRRRMRPRQLLKTCLLFAGTWTLASGQRSADLEMNIHVYDYAGVDPGVLAESEAFAARILHKAGLRAEVLSSGPLACGAEVTNAA